MPEQQRPGRLDGPDREVGAHVQATARMQLGLAGLLAVLLLVAVAVAHLAGDFADPRRQLPRAMLAAFALVAVLYLGLAVTMVAVLGGARGSTVPLADLMQRGLGGAASALTAVALAAGACVSARAGGAAWRGSSAAAGCRAAQSPRDGSPARQSGG
jgi:amino acid efflux transporter